MTVHPPICSIIVPSYKSATTIVACLVSLQQQDYSGMYEITVVDSSPDETPEIVRTHFSDVKLIHLPQQTDPALARNIGAHEAQGTYLMFMDSDCIAPSDWISKLANTLDEGYDAVGGAIGNCNPEADVSWAGYFSEFREFLPGGNARDALNLTLGNAAYRADIFRAVGGFPSGCFPQEDQVFHQALRQIGARIRLNPQVVVLHTHRNSRHAFLRHQRMIGRANARVLCQLRLSGSVIVERRWLACLALPALITVRFARTVLACLHVERGRVLRPNILLLLWLGMCWWGLGLLEGAGGQEIVEETSACRSSSPTLS